MTHKRSKTYEDLMTVLRGRGYNDAQAKDLIRQAVTHIIKEMSKLERLQLRASLLQDKGPALTTTQRDKLQRVATAPQDGDELFIGALEEQFFGQVFFPSEENAHRLLFKVTGFLQ